MHISRLVSTAQLVHTGVTYDVAAGSSFGLGRETGSDTAARPLDEVLTLHRVVDKYSSSMYNCTGLLFYTVGVVAAYPCSCVCLLKIRAQQQPQRLQLEHSGVLGRARAH